MLADDLYEKVCSHVYLLSKKLDIIMPAFTVCRMAIIG